MRGESATLYRAADGSNAYLSGLNTCGNGWTCPVCGAKIAEHRRRELSEAMAAWTNAEGGTAYLVTLTFPHAAGDDLGAMVYAVNADAANALGASSSVIIAAYPHS